VRETVRTRLYLVTPPELASGGVALADFAPQFEAALSGGDVAAVLLLTRGGEEAHLRAAIAALRPLVHAADAALVVEERADLAAELDCDGVQVRAEPATLRAVRRALGNDMIVGALCGDSRHEAMIAGELDVDYVGFDGAALETIAWWAEMMEVPCVAGNEPSGAGIALDAAPAMLQTGAEFLAVGTAVWTHAKGPAAAVTAFNRLLDAAR
jgi:thiamine-phosphate pyrophosphorylase